MTFYLLLTGQSKCGQFIALVLAAWDVRRSAEVNSRQFDQSVLCLCKSPFETANAEVGNLSTLLTVSQFSV